MCDGDLVVCECVCEWCASTCAEYANGICWECVRACADDVVPEFRKTIPSARVEWRIIELDVYT